MIFLIHSAVAHKPSFGSYSSEESAFFVQDPQVSIVVYQDITCDEHQLWLELDGEAGMEVYIQGGIPEIARLEDYQPTIALLAPGLPHAENLPFDVPTGVGAVVLTPDDQPSDFFEPFTQTDSWIWIEETLVLPEQGTAYIVGWNDEQWTGKMWIATGTVEDFSDVEVTEFLEWGERVNNFHETGKYEIPYPSEETACFENTPDASKQTKGCQHTNENYAALPMLLAFLIFRRERL